MSESTAARDDEIVIANPQPLDRVRIEQQQPAKAMLSDAHSLQVGRPDAAPVEAAFRAFA